MTSASPIRGRELTALMLASALITLDGTATAVALPALGRDLSMSMADLQWCGSATLLVLAAGLLPAGVAADRYGRSTVIRVGTATFALASIASAAAWSPATLITARMAQGAGGALLLPAVLAVLRSAYPDARERTQKFGVWAAWTGLASGIGPLLGGALVDLVSWRAVFVTSASLALIAIVLIEKGRGQPERAAPIAEPFPLLTAFALVVLLGAVAYVFIEGARLEWRASPGVIAALLVGAAMTVLLVRSPDRSLVFPRELIGAHNCLPANCATFALYFGLFGSSFLLVMYTQQVLGYSALWAAVALLPISAMLALAEPFGRLAPRLGSRPFIMSGVLVAALGIFWTGTGPHPLPFWSRMIVGTGLFGLGVSLAVSPLTHAAVSAVPERWSGAASGLNHATVRAAGLVAVALLGSMAAPGDAQSISVDGFQRAMFVCGAVVALGGVASSVLVKNHEPGGLMATT